MDKDMLFDLLKPAPFMPEQEDDPETLHRDLEEYLERIRLFFQITEAGGTHLPGHHDLILWDGADQVTCEACVKETDMLISIGGQEMTRMLTQVGEVTGDDQYDSAVRQGISGLAEVSNISLRCDRCDYETKSCRRSRAKKHLTSHCEKHHRDVSENVYHVEFDSCDACHVGRDGREVSRGVVEQNIHGETEEDSLLVGEDTGKQAKHVGGGDGPEVQCVLGEDQEAGESREVWHDVSDGRGVPLHVAEQSLQSDTVEDSLQVGEYTVPEVRHVGGEDGHEVKQIVGQGQEDGEDSDCGKQGLHGGEAAQDKPSVEGGAGEDSQCTVLAQVSLLAGENRGEEEQGGAVDDPQCAVVAQVGLGGGSTIANRRRIPIHSRPLQNVRCWQTVALFLWRLQPRLFLRPHQKRHSNQWFPSVRRGCFWL